jgi:hypothetical protein
MVDFLPGKWQQQQQKLAIFLGCEIVNLEAAKTMFRKFFQQIIINC